MMLSGPVFVTRRSVSVSTVVLTSADLFRGVVVVFTVALLIIIFPFVADAFTVPLISSVIMSSFCRVPKFRTRELIKS
jgi:hypothetical protein